MTRMHLHCQNPLTRAAQTPEGQAVVVKVLAIRDEGHECLSIIRKISSGPLALLSNNHCLPLIKEFVFEDIILVYSLRQVVCLKRPGEHGHEIQLVISLICCCKYWR